MIFLRTKTSAARASFLARLLLPLAMIVPSLSNAADCGERPVCVEAAAGNGDVELLAVNRQAFPVTLSLDMDLVNLRPAGDAPAQWVLPPNQPVSLMRLAIADPDRPWDYRYRMSWSRGDYRATHDDSYVYGLPYQPGPGFPVSQSYNGEFSHNGDASYAIDFAMPEGTPVVAAREGVVASVRADSTVGGPRPEYMDEANYVVVEHADGTFAEYLHLKPNGVRVDIGQRVARGQLLGYSGNTGFSGGPHLHFMVAGATADGGRRSFPVRFQTDRGVVAQLQVGERYLPGSAPLVPDAAAEGIATTVDADSLAAPALDDVQTDAGATGAGAAVDAGS